jgi:membrane dipeptidase
MKEVSAAELHHDAIVIDATCPLLQDDDTHLHLYQEGGCTAVAPTIRANTGTSADAIIQFGYWLRRERERDDVIIARRPEDIARAKNENKIALILHFQGTEVLDRSVDILDSYHALGLRVVQLTYNKRSHVGDGAEEPSDAGLSRYGKSVVRRLNDLGIAVDCAHTGVRTALDAVEHSTAPVIISHANARAVRDIPRNAPDHLYKAIAGTGGVIGVVGFPNFVADSPRPTLDQFIDHIAHIANLVGVDHVGLGIDYYSGQYPFSTIEEAQAKFQMRVKWGVWSAESYPEPPYYYPEGIETPDKLANLTAGLLRRGFSAQDVRKVLGENWLRVYRSIWK